MNRYNKIICFGALMACLSSCQKIQENKIIAGTWEVMKVELNHTSENAMEVFLRHYVSNSECCHYIVDFKDDRTCESTYYHSDTIVYKVKGEWHMVDFNLVFVKLDRYVNAELDVDRHSKKFYTLFSETNKVEIFNNNEYPTKLEIKRID